MSDETTTANINPAALKTCWQVTLALYAALLVCLTVDHTLVRQSFYWPVWLMQTVPLLALAPGLLKRHSRSGIWLCFMILFHFLLAVDNFAISPHKLLYGTMAVIIIALFITSLLFARWQARV